MHRYTKLLLTSLAATVVLGLTVGSASARTLSVNSGNFRVTWASLNLSNTAGLGSVVRCPVTLEGSFHSRSIVKVARALIGYVTVARNGTCTGGTATIHNESLPWHLTYESFAGTLPNITEITLLLVGVFFEINNGAATCSARTEPRNNAAGIARIDPTTRRITSLAADPSRRIPLTGGLCALTTGFFEGAGTVTQQGNSTGITVTLI
jgi:hypothetical protein